MGFEKAEASVRELLGLLSKNGALTAESEALCRNRAEEHRRQGEGYDLAGKPGKAEESYLQALKLYDRLSRRTGKSCYGATAGEISMALAELCMEQGNMHGADRYYVQALTYRQG